MHDSLYDYPEGYHQSVAHYKFEQTVITLQTKTTRIWQTTRKNT